MYICESNYDALKKIFTLLATMVFAIGCVDHQIDEPVGGKTVVLTADVESLDTGEDGVGTSEVKAGAIADAQSGKVRYVWTKGDQIAVQVSGTDFSSFQLVGDGGTGHGKFTGTAQPVSHALAVYPASAVSAIDGANLTLDFPGSYTYSDGQTNAVMSAVVDSDNNILFRHLVGTFKVEVADVPAGANLVLTADGMKINGVYSIDMSGRQPSVQCSSATELSQSSVVVEFPQAQSLATVYIPLPAGEYKSLTVSVLDKDGEVIEGSQRATSSPRTFARGCMRVFPKIVMNLPQLSLAARVYNMEKVAVSYGNIAEGKKVAIDWGDGSPVEVFTAGNSSNSGPDTILHQFVNESGIDKTCTVTLTADGQTVTRDIYVYSLTALTEVARRFKSGECTDVWVMAHRANTSDKSIPENSIPAVEAAIAAGAKVVETDTRLTADGQIVICHDESISRTTTGTGNISNLTLAQIRSYNLKDRNGKTTTEVMPTLAEFLEAARGKIYVNLDYSPRTASTAQVMSVVEDLGMMEQVLFYCNSAAKVNEVGNINQYAHAYAWNTYYAALKQLPGEHFVQYTYNPDTEPSLGAALSQGMICTVNMLNGVSSSYVEMDKLEQLFKYFPSTRIIQTDVSDKLVDVLDGYPYTSEPRDFFVTPEGRGDMTGNSWDDAMGLQQWRKLVASDDSGSTYGQCGRLDGSVFHFMEGEYCIATPEEGNLYMKYTDYGKMCKVTVLGGYDSSSKGTDLSRRDPAVNITEFNADLNGNGRADTGDCGIFSLDGFVHLKVDGVTFAHSYGVSRWDQKAFMLNTPTSGAQARIDLANCVFHDIYGYKDSETKFHGGSAVWAGKNSLAALDNCRIYDCHAYSRGGALRIAEGTGIIFLNSCAIHDNAITERFGSGVHVTSGSLLANNTTVACNDGHYGVLNGSGNWLLVNSTIVADYVSSTAGSNMVFRSESGSDRTVVLLNTIMLFDGYTSMHVNGSSYSATSLGYNLTGTNNEYFSPSSADKTGCTLSGLGMKWNGEGYYQWSGQVSGFTKATLSAVENSVKTSCSRSAGPYDNIGLEFYNWLLEIGAGKNPLSCDQNGNPRNPSAMWPGAYEKN